MSGEPVITFFLEITTVSEGNRANEHWAIKSKRHRKQKKQIFWFWFENRPKISLPCKIELSRLGPRLLDDDNLVFSFKYIRDSIAECIFPEKKTGQADNDPRIKWTYSQKKSKKKGIEIYFYM